MDELVVDEIEESDSLEEPDAIAFGVVTNCLELNVREEPDQDAKICGTLTCLTEVEVEPSMSTEDFYKIYTVAGVAGFCMKQFITLKE